MQVGTAIEGLTALRAMNGSGIPTELISMRSIVLLQAFVEFVLGCLLIWQTEWCVGPMTFNDRPDTQES
jgi:hypothetical protein